MTQLRLDRRSSTGTEAHPARTLGLKARKRERVRCARRLSTGRSIRAFASTPPRRVVALGLRERDESRLRGTMPTLPSASQAAAAIRPSDVVMMDAVALNSAIHSRQVSCVEVMTAYLDHIDKLNPKVNAIVALQERSGLLAQAAERDAQLARGDSMGPLHGFPHAVKDLHPVKGIRSTQARPSSRTSSLQPTA
jgi:hypothetical protein